MATFKEALRTSLANFSKSIAKTYLKTADIVDNLLSTDSTLPLSAKQGNVLQTEIDSLNSNMSEFVGFINGDYLNTCNILKNLHGVYTESNGLQYVFTQLYCGAYTLQILYANDNTSINDKVAFRVIYTKSDTRETTKWTFLKTSSVVD